MKSNNLELRGLSIGRNGEVLIPPFDCQLNGGDLLVVQGKNGSGKSSLLKCLAGLIPPMSGVASFNGRPLEAGGSPVIYFGHKLGLSPTLSVRENVAFWGDLYGQPELIDVALHYFDLEDIADIAVQTLSAGWQQRVALTRLITIPGTIWLLDEATAHLDEEGISLLHSLFQTRLEQGGIIILTSHVRVEGERIKVLDLSLLNPFTHVGRMC